MSDERFLKVVLHSLREWCEEDDGLRTCCGTAQLGPHREDCTLTPAAQDAMLGHERMYWHETEAGDVVLWLTDT